MIQLRILLSRLEIMGYVYIYIYTMKIGLENSDLYRMKYCRPLCFVDNKRT